MRWWMYVLIALLLAGASCGLFENKKDPEPPPGSRDYTWTVDTLTNRPNGFIMGIWGASPNDVWAGTQTGVYRLWHFDGTKWSPWSQTISPGADFESLYGLAKDDIWGGSDNGEIYHFDGEKWSVDLAYTIKGIYQPEISDIWCTSPTNIYAVGRGTPFPIKSFLLHYDGDRWQKLLVTKFPVQFLRVREERGMVFIEGIKPRYGKLVPDTISIYNYRDGRLYQVLSMTEDEGILQMNKVGDEIYFIVGQKIETYRKIIRTGKIEFSPVLVLPDSIKAIGVSGRNRNDMFIYTADGVMHYDGTDIKYILHVPRDMPGSPYKEMLFKNEVFFTVWGVTAGTTNLIYHGVLPDTTKQQ